MTAIKNLILGLVIFVLCSCASQKPISMITPTGKKPKNIILMIGDGMGLSQITAGMYMNGNKLNLEEFAYIGLHKNYPKDKDLITDSAAGATAFSCGCKTYNAAIGVKADTSHCKTILEIAEANGLATGLVATSTIVHATPASFIAHVKHRDAYEPIALDFMKTEFDLLIGGGKKYFERRTSDSRNLLEELKTKGYQVSSSGEEDLKDVKFGDKNVAYFTAEEHPVPVAQGRDYLPLASKKAVNFLKKRSKKGFFLMIEGSQIDWGGHAGKTDYITSEMVDFDKSIGEVLEFAKKDGETLIIVTADHETGGFAILKGSTLGNVIGGFGDKWDEKGNTYYHTGTMIPVFAYGLGSEYFSGIYENTAIFDKMKALFGF
jgi:alkaline phosphatase